MPRKKEATAIPGAVDSHGPEADGAQRELPAPGPDGIEAPGVDTTQEAVSAEHPGCGAELEADAREAPGGDATQEEAGLEPSGDAEQGEVGSEPPGDAAPDARVPETPPGDAAQEADGFETQRDDAAPDADVPEAPGGDTTREAAGFETPDDSTAPDAAETPGDGPTSDDSPESPGESPALGTDAAGGTEGPIAGVHAPDAPDGPTGPDLPQDAGEDAVPAAKKKRAPRKKAAATPEPGDAAGTAAGDAAGTAAESTQAIVPRPRAPDPLAKRKKSILDLNLNELDRNLSTEERKAWSAIYASYRAKSVLAGTVIGIDSTTLDVMNLETKSTERATLSSLVIIDHRAKVLVPETEMWMPGTERPPYVLKSMVGGTLDYVVLEVDREGECAIGSRRMALAAKRHFFSRARGGHKEGEPMKCRVVVTGAKRCTVECHGYDIELSQRDLSYTAIADLREQYRPGQELDCLLKAYDRESDRLEISVKEAKTNPFIGADNRHPVGSRRYATISGKYAGGVFCTLPDDTVCLCFYSAHHSDLDFDINDKVVIAIRQYNYDRQLIFGRILSKW